MTTTLKNGKGYLLAKAGEGETVPTLHLYDILGEDFLGGVSARRVIADLEALRESPAIDVRLNSSGGDVFEGIAIYNALIRFPGRVTVHVDGLAASIASLVALAGDETLVAENAMLMVHRPWTALAGDAEELRRQAETLEKAWSAMLATYSRRTGVAPASLAQRVADEGGEWWMTASEAVAEGFADRTEEASDEALVFGLERFKRVPERLAARVRPDPDGDPDETHEEASIPPRTAEIATPRVVKRLPVEEDAGVARAASAAVRRRTVEVLRLMT